MRRSLSDFVIWPPVISGFLALNLPKHLYLEMDTSISSKPKGKIPRLLTP
jgi:hypothetical protein